MDRGFIGTWGTFSTTLIKRLLALKNSRKGLCSMKCLILASYLTSAQAPSSRLPRTKKTLAFAAGLYE